MKKRLVFTGLVASFALAAFGHVRAAEPPFMARPDSITPPPLRWEIPAAERFVLANGVVIYLQADAELPLVNFQAMVRTGAIYEPADKVGLATLTGAVMRTGGIAASGRAVSGDALDEELEFRGGSAEAGVDAESGGAAVAVLKKDADFGLALLHDILIYPAFDERKVELAKDRMREGIRRQNDTPDAIAFREWPKEVYGADSPWARTPTLASVAGITRDDLVAFHARYFRPGNVTLMVYGDFDAAEMKKKINRVFGDWAAEETSFPAVAPVAVDFSPAVYLAAKAGRNQSTVLMGHLGLRRHNPDFFKCLVMNEVMTGGFGSRMVREVRTTRGLAYATGASITEGTDYGAFSAYAATKSASTVETINVMKNVIAGMAATPPPEEELAAAKDAILNRFVFLFDGRTELLSRLATREYYGYPADYYETYRDNVAAVTAADAEGAAATYLHPDAMKILVVGDPALFDKPLSTLGPVNEVSLEIK